MKRLFDLGFSAFTLLLISPLLLLLILLIKCTSKGPAFYLSKRIGHLGKPIHCWKFRTMHLHAEEKLGALLRQSPTLCQEWNSFQKLKKDPRVTRLGTFLRKTSLDELPQFFDVLRGRLSVVGPRPFLLIDETTLEEEIQKTFGPLGTKILSVKPGLTGLWQTSGRSHLSMKERLTLDELYVEKRSMLLDLRLILRTIPLFLFPHGSF